MLTGFCISVLILQLLVSYSRSNEAPADSFMQGDEAGEEGSGSGRSWSSDDYDTEGSGDDGSGEIEGRKYKNIQLNYQKDQFKTSSI